MSDKYKRMQSMSFLGTRRSKIADNVSFLITPMNRSNKSIRGLVITSPSIKSPGKIKLWRDLSNVNYVPDSSSVSLSSELFLHITKERDKEEFINVEHKCIAKVPPANTSTTFLNKYRPWGYYYVYPEFYDDDYSPMIKINDCDVSEGSSFDGMGVLSQQLAACCLSYLAKNPILDAYVFIKCDLSARNIVDIDVLSQYRYLQILNLASNDVANLNVLAELPYLQSLNVNHNKLTSVLDYDAPQWYLTEVLYRFNLVTSISDLRPYWSLCILDLSHNKITKIDGLNGLRFLRSLDLSFNRIRKLENISCARLKWLDLSNNNISTFECGPGLSALHDLEYLNTNENELDSLQFVQGCVRLYEFHCSHNNLSDTLDLVAYLRSCRSLRFLDLRQNDMCRGTNYKTILLNILPCLVTLDSEYVDPVDHMAAKMEVNPDIMVVARRRLLRIMYVEQLSIAKSVSQMVPADSSAIPLIVLCGLDTKAKNILCKSLASEMGKYVRFARHHTTSANHDHLIQTSMSEIDKMLLAGQLLTYTMQFGEIFGLSRAEAYPTEDGRAAITCTDLVSGLILKLRGLRPYLILTTGTKDPPPVERKPHCCECMGSDERATIKLLASSKNAMASILDGILDTIPVTEKSVSSEPSLLSEWSMEHYSTLKPRQCICSCNEIDSAVSTEDVSSYHSFMFSAKNMTVESGEVNTHYFEEDINMSPIDIDSPFASKSNMGMWENKSLKSVKSVKSVTFGIEDYGPELQEFEETKSSKLLHFVCNEFSELLKNILSAELVCERKDSVSYLSDGVRLHTENPGLFWATLNLDNLDAAYLQLKKLVEQIVESHQLIKPMYDVNFSEMNDTIIKKKITRIRDEIAPRRVFF